jgi:atypical dual specificity phosphatase
MLARMWTWSLNWGEITPRIVVGTCPMTPADLERIGEGAGVSAVLSLQHDECLAYWRIDYREMQAHGSRFGLRMLRSPMRDFDIADQRRRLPHAVAALAQLQTQGHRTYVHCTAGLGRGPLTVLSYLVCVEGRSPAEAIESIRPGSPGAVPAWEAYHGFREDLAGRHRSRIEQRAYALYQSRAGGRGDTQTDWVQAEAEVLRAALVELGASAEKRA